ncbi:MAG: ABC transporter ATP-binding protein [Myxococcota bacterium]|nr:ABC transporter ATP-binding protein [Myxococcota bacterium]
MEKKEETGWLRRYLGVFRYTRRAIELVWDTSPTLTVAFAFLTILGGLLPPAMAWVGKELIDAVLLAIDSKDTSRVVYWIAFEAGLVALFAAFNRALGICETLLRAQLSNRVNVIILEKALTLGLSHFEDADFYDKMTRARRQASVRPLSLVKRAFRLIQNAISLVSYGLILLSFSWLAVLLLMVAAIPSFIAENKFAQEGFQIFRWQSKAKREQLYLETVVARDDYAKEVILLGIGPRLVKRYGDIFTDLYGEDRKLIIKRSIWGFLLSLISMITLYGAYFWIAFAAVASTITLGTMTMYFMSFKQGQQSFSMILQCVGGMYEDNLYLSNLYEYLEQTVESGGGTLVQGPRPGDGIRFENVYFTYPGASEPALKGINLHIAPGEKLAIVGHNGSGKTTLIKLLSGLYFPQKGRITLDGLSLGEWEPKTLRQRIGVIFQDFLRYQFSVGENIGVGDLKNIDNQASWEEASQKGMAKPFIDQLPDGYETHLGRWFGGRELSLGQWQKIALSRAFMRKDADILVLDEPTAAMDAEAEAQIFERFRGLTKDQLAILISHRFSTVRMADSIVVLDQGKIIESGRHADLMHLGGQYATLFNTQAAGYTA